MSFSDKSRYGRTFQQVTHKGGEYAMDYIKRFQNAEALSFSVGNYYSEDQMMHTFLDNFHQGRKYSAHISIHQAELRREARFTYQKYLYISFFQTDHLNLYSISGFVGKNERENTVQTKCKFCGSTNNSTEKCLKSTRKEKEKTRAAGH